MALMLDVLAAALAYPLVTLVHEIGHLLVACALRGEIRTFQAGPVSLAVDRSTLRAGLRLTRWFGGGMVRYRMPSGTSALGRIAIIAAGPAFSLAYAGVVACGWPSVPLLQLPAQSFSLPDMLVYSQFWMSIIVAIVTAWPFRRTLLFASAPPSDGELIVGHIRRMLARS